MKIATKKEGTELCTIEKGNESWIDDKVRKVSWTSQVTECWVNVRNENEFGWNCWQRNEWMECTETWIEVEWILISFLSKIRSKVLFIWNTPLHSYTQKFLSTLDRDKRKKWAAPSWRWRFVLWHVSDCASYLEVFVLHIAKWSASNDGDDASPSF